MCTRCYLHQGNHVIFAICLSVSRLFHNLDRFIFSVFNLKSKLFVIYMYTEENLVITDVFISVYVCESSYESNMQHFQHLAHYIQ